MMRKLIAFLLISLFYFYYLPSAIHGQYCGTTFSTSEMIEFGKLKKENNLNFKKGKINIPIKLHFVKYRDILQINIEEVEEKISILNEAFQDGGISFFLCSFPNYIEGKNVYNLNELKVLFHESHSKHALNVYIANKINFRSEFGEPRSIDGFAQFFSYIFLTPNGFQYDEIFIHEIGHYLGLLHTHETEFGEELVNGSNCDIAGDLICDTPADPNLWTLGSCNYNKPHTDSNGDTFDPDVTNYMSYALPQCLNKFTSQQFSEMSANANWLHSSSNSNCQEISIDETNIFPNPLNQTHLNILLNNNFKQTKLILTLSNVEGKISKQIESYKKEEEIFMTMNVNDISKGVYFLSVYYVDENKVTTFKVLKN